MTFFVSIDKPFLTQIRDIILQTLDHCPLKLSNTIVLMPSKRGCLGLHKTFKSLKTSTLLPKCIALSELATAFPSQNMTPNSLSPFKRLFFLQKLIESSGICGHDQSFIMAKSMSTTLDEVLRVTDDLKNAGQLALFSDNPLQDLFLKILSLWPDILTDENSIESADLYRHHIDEFKTRIKAHPPCALFMINDVGDFKDTQKLQDWVESQDFGYVIQQDNPKEFFLKPDDLKKTNLIEAENMLEEVRLLTLICRYHLEKKQTLTIVTQNQKMGFYLKEELNGYGISLNSSFGEYVHRTQLGQFFLLIAEILSTPQLSQRQFLAFLKSPYFSNPTNPLDLETIFTFEKNIVRKDPCLPLSTLIEKSDSSILKDIFNRLSQFRHEFCTPHFLKVHHACFEWFLKQETLDTPERTSVTDFINKLFMCDQGLFPLFAKNYVEVIQTLFQEITYHTPSPLAHVHLVGKLESRFVQTDVVILADLNEGSWPSTSFPTPWIHSSFANNLGLSNDEQKINEERFYFLSTFSCNTIYLTRSLQQLGQKNMASRFFERTSLFLEKQGLPKSQIPWNDFLKLPISQALLQEMSPPIPPSPILSFEDKPKNLYVTQIQTLMRDPYLFYAKHILKIHPLEKCDQELTPVVFGSLLHKILERFTGHKDLYNQDLFQKIAKEFLTPYLPHLERTHWWYRIKSLSTCLPDIFPDPYAHYACEQKGSISLKGITLMAMADRLTLFSDGKLSISDYKTGALPSTGDILSGFSPQMPLEGLIAKQGGFSFAFNDLGLEFIALKGKGKDPIETKILPKTEELLICTLENVSFLLDCYLKDSWTFLCNPHLLLPFMNAYDHFERTQEWQPYLKG